MSVAGGHIRIATPCRIRCGRGASLECAGPAALWPAAAWRRFDLSQRGGAIDRIVMRTVVAPGRDRPKRRRAAALQGDALGTIEFESKKSTWVVELSSCIPHLWIEGIS